MRARGLTAALQGWSADEMSHADLEGADHSVGTTSPCCTTPYQA
jgi:hypothetical protein